MLLLQNIWYIVCVQHYFILLGWGTTSRFWFTFQVRRATCSSYFFFLLSLPSIFRARFSVAVSLLLPYARVMYMCFCMCMAGAIWRHLSRKQVRSKNRELLRNYNLNYPFTPAQQLDVRPCGSIHNTHIDWRYWRHDSFILHTHTRTHSYIHTFVWLLISVKCDISERASNSIHTNAEDIYFPVTTGRIHPPSIRMQGERLLGTTHHHAIQRRCVYPVRQHPCIHRRTFTHSRR